MLTSRPASGRNADSPQRQKAASPKQPPARLVAPSCGNSAARPLQPPPRRAKRRRQANRTPTPHTMGAPDSSGARRRRAKRASAREPDGNDAPDESGASRSNRACRLHEGLETCLRQVGAARAPRFRSKTDTTSLPELGSLGVYVGPTPQQVRARAQSRSTLSISSRSSLDASHQRGTGALPGPSTGA